MFPFTKYRFMRGKNNLKLFLKKRYKLKGYIIYMIVKIKTIRF